MIYYLTRESDGEMFVATETDGSYSVVLDSERPIYNDETEQYETEVDEQTKNSVVSAIENSEQTEYAITKGEE
jgi:hypothetical protein